MLGERGERFCEGATSNLAATAEVRHPQTPWVAFAKDTRSGCCVRDDGLLSTCRMRLIKAISDKS